MLGLPGHQIHSQQPRVQAQRQRCQPSHLCFCGPPLERTPVAGGFTDAHERVVCLPVVCVKDSLPILNTNPFKYLHRQPGLVALPRPRH
jgi:hypothetical protein